MTANSSSGPELRVPFGAHGAGRSLVGHGVTGTLCSDRLPTSKTGGIWSNSRAWNSNTSPRLANGSGRQWDSEHPSVENDAEIQAIVVAVKKLLNTDLGSHPVVFLTDARSVLQALQAKRLPDLQILLYEICRHCRVKMQWIPSHCGIPGNENADRLAKEGAAEEQPDVLITYHQKKKMIKSFRNAPIPPRDEYHGLSRPEQVIILRLRTGHNRLCYHMYTKFKIGNTALCTCRQAPQTTEHILQDCLIYEGLRQTHWPRPTSLRDKLYGQMHELQRTLKFIEETELQI